MFNCFTLCSLVLSCLVLISLISSSSLLLCCLVLPCFVLSWFLLHANKYSAIMYIRLVRRKNESLCIHVCVLQGFFNSFISSEGALHPILFCVALSCLVLFNSISFHSNLILFRIHLQFSIFVIPRFLHFFSSLFSSLLHFFTYSFFSSTFPFPFSSFLSSPLIFSPFRKLQR